MFQTDAPATGLGYVLSQGGSDREKHPIIYVSRKLPREQRYSTIEREAMALWLELSISVLIWKACHFK